MKKYFKMIFVIIIFLITIILLDSIQALVFNNNPLIGIQTRNMKKVGILVETHHCGNGKHDTVIKGFSHSCSFQAGNFILVDETKDIKDFACDEALESFYEDENYTYYWSCIKNNYMIVKYDDGAKELISDALNQNHIDIQMLDKFKINYIKMKKEIYSKDYILNPKEEENCNLKINEYYKYNDRTIYTACLKEIYVQRKNSDGILTLKKYLSDIDQPFDRSVNELVSDMQIISTLKDGGTTTYRKDNYTIILCNTIEGNKDIYIGNKYFKYEQGYCK